MSDYASPQASSARDDSRMASWREVETAVPELAAKVKGRFDAYGVGFIATVRRDGAPRISGIEMIFGAGELWIGMMPGSLKAIDLIRDPRFALHSASTDKDVSEGDAKLSGRALEVEDEVTWQRYIEASGYESKPGDFFLFRIDVTEISHLIPEGGDHLNIEWWNESDGYRQLDRY